MGLKLNNLKPAPGATRKRKRIGRGEGSGRGTTAGRGHKGQKSRSGYSRRFGFEGGQMPLIRRLPKRGFRNTRFRTEYSEVNVVRLAEFDAGTEVTPELLRQRRMIRKMRDGVKILGDGELSVGLTVHAHAFTKTAREKIEAAGGKAVVIEKLASQATAAEPTEEEQGEPETASTEAETTEEATEPEAAASEEQETEDESSSEEKAEEDTEEETEEKDD